MSNITIATSGSAFPIAPGNTTYYVSTTGSDSNNGLTVGTAFATIQHASNVIASQSWGPPGASGITFEPTIQLEDGTYNYINQGIVPNSQTQIEFPALIGNVGGRTTLQGNAVTPSNVVIDLTPVAFFFQSGGSGTGGGPDHATFKIQNLQLDIDALSIVSNGQATNVSLFNLIFNIVPGANQTQHILFNSGLFSGLFWDTITMQGGVSLPGDFDSWYTSATGGLGQGHNANVTLTVDFYATRYYVVATYSDLRADMPPNNFFHFTGPVPVEVDTYSIFSTAASDPTNFGSTPSTADETSLWFVDTFGQRLTEQIISGLPTTSLLFPTAWLLSKDSVGKGNYLTVNDGGVMKGIMLGGLVPNYQTPATGFSLTLGNNDLDVILDPAGVLATGTITMCPAPVDAQKVKIWTSQTVTALTMAANAGQSLANGAPTTIAAGKSITSIYKASNTKWYFGD